MWLQAELSTWWDRNCCQQGCIWFVECNVTAGWALYRVRQKLLSTRLSTGWDRNCCQQGSLQGETETAVNKGVFDLSNVMWLQAQLSTGWDRNCETVGGRILSSGRRPIRAADGCHGNTQGRAFQGHFNVISLSVYYQGHFNVISLSLCLLLPRSFQCHITLSVYYQGHFNVISLSLCVLPRSFQCHIVYLKSFT